jgi:hypothetical protein
MLVDKTDFDARRVIVETSIPFHRLTTITMVPNSAKKVPGAACFNRRRLSPQAAFSSPAFS